MDRRGFTMVEIILYVVLFAMTASALSSVYVSSLATDSIAKREQDLVETRRNVGIILREAVQGANVVSSPASGSGTVLTVDGPGVANGPATFSVTDGRLYLQASGLPAEAITPADLNVGEFTVTRLPSSPPGIHVQLTMTVKSGSTDLTETSDFIVTLRYE